MSQDVAQVVAPDTEGSPESGSWESLEQVAARGPRLESIAPTAADGVHRAAAWGLKTPSGTMPHAERIQRAFGAHPLGDIRAHVGPQAALSSDAMGAQAYTSGSHIVFSGQPDLRTAAHEAAHVVQQRAGVRLPGGVDQGGDPHERHAEQVAERVVAGRSAEDLLNTVNSQPGLAAAAPASASPSTPVVQRRRGKKLNPKQEAQRQKLLERSQRHSDQERERERRDARISSAESAFYTAVQSPGGSALSHHNFPFDVQGTQPVDQAIDRLPSGLRSESFANIATLPDAAHGESERRTEIGKNSLQEALAAWQFSKERGLKPGSVESHSASIDFKARDANDKEVLFDPFMSPLAGPGQQPTQGAQSSWAQANSGGSYYKHTHSKGGNASTVGVWDQTYSSPTMVSSLKSQLQQSGADQNTNVHELRVPLGRMYAEEHVAAEQQLANSARQEAEARNHWDTVVGQYDKAHRGVAPHQRISFEEALIETRNGQPSPRALQWRQQLAKHPYWANKKMT